MTILTRRTPISLLAAVSIGVLATEAVAANSGLDQSASPAALDLSSYDCASGGAPHGSSVHLGQIIEGQYREWFQFHQSAEDGGRLICISTVYPRPEMLSAADAAELIRKSSRPGTQTTPIERAQSADEVDPSTLLPPIPLPRVDHSQPSAPQGAERQQSNSDSNFPVQHSNQAGQEKQNNAPPRPRASTELDVEHQATVGVDDRQRNSPSAYPWNTIGYLAITFPDGASGSCTGTLVSQYVVLTAGHCIHNNIHGGWATRLTFYPAQDQTTAGGPVSRPYGGNSDWKTEFSTKAWTSISGPDSHPLADYEGDYAAIGFATPFTYTTTFMPVVFNNTDGANDAGYPGTVGGISNNFGMWLDSGNEDSTSISVLRLIHLREFLIDASPGNSGGPFWTYNSATNQRALTGSLSYGDDGSGTNDRAGGPWYDGWNQSILTSWLTWTPTSSSISTTSPVAGLRVPGVFSSLQPGSQSFIRLFNPSTQAGTVQVTLSDYQTGSPLGTWTSPTIPPLAELQFGISTLETGADKSFTLANFYSLSVRPTFSGYFQHVLWKKSDGSLTNLTMCDSRVTSNPTMLFGVHSSTLQSGYPSYIVIENTSLSATNVTLGIYDANTGAKLATYTSPSIPANGQYISTVTNIEAAATPKVTPTSSMYHYIVKAESIFQGELQHIMINTSSGVITDLTSYCAMSPVPAS